MFNILTFVTGIICSIVFLALFRTLKMLQLNLYLISEDIREQKNLPDHIDQTFPYATLTSAIKKKYLLSMLMKKNWIEDLEITLLDYDQTVFKYWIGYHLWRGFFIQLTNTPAIAVLQDQSMTPHKKYYLKTGMKLKAGNRDFKILIKY